MQLEFDIQHAHAVRIMVGAAPRENPDAYANYLMSVWGDEKSLLNALETLLIVGDDDIFGYRPLLRNLDRAQLRAAAHAYARGRLWDEVSQTEWRYK